MKLDINTAFIDDNTQIWAMHAGKGKRYFKEFSSAGAAFLDLPGFPFEQDIIKNEKKLEQNLLMSLSIRDFYNGRFGSAEPSRNPSDYAINKIREHNLVSEKANVRRFYNEVNPGDLIISAPRRAYDPLLIGIVSRRMSANDKFIIEPFFRDKFSYLPISWLPVKTSKHFVSPGLAIRLENPRAIINIDRNIFGEEVFSIAFKNYQSGNTSKVDVECPGYRGKNPLETVPAQELIAFFSAIYYLHEERRLSDISNSSFDDIINQYYDDEVIGALIPRLNSPLNFRLITRRPRLAAFIAAGISLATVGALNVDVISKLTITNSASKQQGYTDNELHNLLKSTVKAVKPDVVKRANDRGKQAKKEVGLKTAAKISD